jgi:hypothetical protein
MITLFEPIECLCEPQLVYNNNYSVTGTVHGVQSYSTRKGILSDEEKAIIKFSQIQGAKRNYYTVQ